MVHVCQGVFVCDQGRCKTEQNGARKRSDDGSSTCTASSLHWQPASIYRHGVPGVSGADKPPSGCRTHSGWRWTPCRCWWEPSKGPSFSWTTTSVVSHVPLVSTIKSNEKTKSKFVVLCPSHMRCWRQIWGWKCLHDVSLPPTHPL